MKQADVYVHTGASILSPPGLVIRGHFTPHPSASFPLLFNPHLAIWQLGTRGTKINPCASIVSENKAIQ
jgi:hypothetical protein